MTWSLTLLSIRSRVTLPKCESQIHGAWSKFLNLLGGSWPPRCFSVIFTPWIYALCSGHLCCDTLSMWPIVYSRSDGMFSTFEARSEEALQLPTSFLTWILQNERRLLTWFPERIHRVRNWGLYLTAMWVNLEFGSSNPRQAFSWYLDCSLMRHLEPAAPS